MEIARNLVVRATFWWSCHWISSTGGFDGSATNFGSLLEKFYLLYQTPENILLKIFYM